MVLSSFVSGIVTFLGYVLCGSRLGPPSSRLRQFGRPNKPSLVAVGSRVATSSRRYPTWRTRPRLCVRGDPGPTGDSHAPYLSRARPPASYVSRVPPPCALVHFPENLSVRQRGKSHNGERPHRAELADGLIDQLVARVKPVAANFSDLFQSGLLLRGLFQCGFFLGCFSHGFTSLLSPDGVAAE